MSEYMEREALIDWFRPYGHNDEPIPFEALVEYIRDVASAADVAPVVHGRWREDTDPADGDLRCTHCGTAWPKCVQKQIEEQGIWTLQTLFKYCPNCGAKMDAEGEESK